MELIWKQLRGVYVNDFQLPITVLEDPYFDRQIHLLEDSFGAATKYLELMTTIRDYFNGNPQAFLEHRRSVKDKILNEILGSEAYKAMLADKSPLEDYKQLVGSRELYTEEQDGGMLDYYDFIAYILSQMKFVIY